MTRRESFWCGYFLGAIIAAFCLSLFQPVLTPFVVTGGLLIGVYGACLAVTQMGDA